ncbi:MAG TPA: hypothetical protein VFQ68_11705 [Streptosporangiaceae bacterium]|nr:hypothetical protein [Streptosporangiaceae bacterium]
MVSRGFAWMPIRYVMGWVAMPQSIVPDIGSLGGTIQPVQLASEPGSSQPG